MKNNKDNIKNKNEDNQPDIISQGTEENKDINTSTPLVEIFGQHAKRVEPLLKKGALESSVLSSFWGRRFAFNSDSVNNLLEVGSTNLKKIAKKHGFRENLIADTIEEPNARILSDIHDLSNSTIKQDNYEFFLHNADRIGLSLSKILLAKTEKDRNLKKSLEDILDPNGEWINASPDVVTKEVYNRLKKRSLYNIPEIQTLMKVLKKISIIKAQENDYQKSINEERNNVLERLKKGYAGEIFPDLDINDDISLQDNYGNILLSLQVITDFKSINDKDETLASYLNRLEDYFIKYDITNEKEIEVRNALSDLGYELNNREELRYLFTSKVSDIKKNVNRALGYFDDETLQSFDEYTKKYLESGHSINQNVALVLDVPPRAVLLSLYDDKVFKDFQKDNIDKEYLSIIKGVLNVDDKKANEVFNNLREILRNNNEAVENVVKLEEQEKYNPLTFSINDKKNDIANKLLQESIALAIFKTENRDVFEEVYTPEAQKQLLTSITSESLSSKRPDINEVSDVFNTYLMLHKATTSSISDDEIDKMMDSSIFQDSTVLNNKDIENVKKFSKDLSRESEKVFADITAGMPNQDELSFAIQEMAYMDIARQQTAKLKFTPTNIGRFFRNNMAIHSFSKCMEAAKNPSNNVETTPSMSKDCIGKLRDRLEQDAKLADEALSKAGIFAAFNPFTTLLMIQSILSKAQADMLEREMIKATQRISENISYVERTSDNIEKMARQMLVEASYAGVSDSFVDKNIANRVAEKIKTESIAYNLANTKRVELKGVFKARFSELEIDLNNISLENSKKALFDLSKYRNDLYEKAIDASSKGENISKYHNELKKIDRIFTGLQTKIITDNITVAANIETKLKDMNLNISIDNIVKDIEKNGLGDKQISNLFSKIDNNETKSELLLFINNSKNALETLANDDNGMTKSDKASSVAIYLSQLRNNNKEISSLLEATSSQFTAVDRSGDKGYIQTGRGLDGYILQELQKEKDKMYRYGEDADIDRVRTLGAMSSDKTLSNQTRTHISSKSKSSIEIANKELLRSKQQRDRERTTTSISR